MVVLADFFVAVVSPGQLAVKTVSLLRVWITADSPKSPSANRARTLPRDRCSEKNYINAMSYLVSKSLLSCDVCGGMQCGTA